MQLTTNNPNIIVVNNFYQDPHAVKQLAINSEYHPPRMVGPYHQNFSGCLSLQNYHPAGLSQYVSKLLGKHVRAIPKSRHGNFRYAVPGDLPSSLVHCDHEKDDRGNILIDYSLVVYLSENAPDPVKNGTTFFRHKQLQCNHATEENELITSNDLNNPDAWDIESIVGFTWNKAVLFDSTLFHGPGTGFGTSKEDARCVQVFYFHNFNQ